MTESETKESRLAKSIVDSASPEQREALLAWAVELKELSKSSLSNIEKVRQAVKSTTSREILAPIFQANLKRTKEILWSERNFTQRFFIIGITIGTLGFSGKMAGLAAFGRAIAVPIWLVLGLGGMFLGAIIDLLQAESTPSTPSTSYRVIEAHEESGDE